jgi:hypothetical protein
MSTVSLPDPLAAMCAWLRANPEVSPLLDPIPNGLKGIPAGMPAVFRPDLPQAIDPGMPLACIIVRPAGGYRMFGDSMLLMSDPRFDLICYGSNQTEATGIARAVATELKQLYLPQTWEHTVLYSATVNSGPVPLPDTATLWPAAWLQATVTHGDLPSAA